MNLPELIVGGVGLVGTVISILTVRTFRIRKWKESMYYFIGGLLILTLYQLVAGFELLTSGWLRGTVETGFVTVTTIGIYKIQQTARTVGA
jgi:uncharacterized membrane protein